MASYNNMKEQTNNGGAGRYTSNGFIPSRATSDRGNDNKGCFGALILFVLSASALAYGVIACIS